jgi:hypothetical protein
METIKTAAQYIAAVILPLLWAILWLACLTFHAGQAVAEWWHSAPTQATDTTDLILAKFQDGRFSSTISISTSI